jgi:hypothetical protein
MTAVAASGFTFVSCKSTRVVVGLVSLRCVLRNYAGLSLRTATKSYPHIARNLKKKRIPSIFKDESTGSCICPWKLAVAVATYISICIV